MRAPAASTPPEGRLTLAVSAKGRLAAPALELLCAAGLTFEVSERSLVVPCCNTPLDLLRVRAHDIPEYVSDGVVDAGITGANLVVETAAQVTTLCELGFGRCSLAVAVPKDAPYRRLSDLDGKRVASAYPLSARNLLEAAGVEVELVPLSGSVEAAPRLGLADAVVDLVSTGSTASANGLRILAHLLDSQAVLIAASSADGRRRELLERLKLMLSAVVAARRRRYVMMNAPQSALPAIQQLLPAMRTPSVVPLAEEGMIAVHAAVEADALWDLLPLLEEAGASSILVLPIERLVP